MCYWMDAPTIIFILAVLYKTEDIENLTFK
jgi:hypothetical protein